MHEEQIHTTWLNSDRYIPRRFIRPALEFAQVEAASGIILLLAAIVAIAWANAPFGETYAEFWHTYVKIEVGSFVFKESLQHLVNDGLMAIFFFVVGLEIKRELVLGELRDPKAAALPAIAALGGMVLPALIYVAFVSGVGGEALNGWGIPMATDIAFSLGVVALLGSRVPIGAKMFLLALAIADDIGAIAVIAIFYTDDLHLTWLVAGLLLLGLVHVAKVVGIRSYLFYVPVAAVIWFCFLESGVHATLAGVALGLLTPARPMYSSEEFDRRARRILDLFPVHPHGEAAREKVDHEAMLLATIATEAVSPLSRLEHRLHPWSSFVIVPIFALANAGVRFVGMDVGAAVTHPITLGVALGLLVGKTVGISLFTVGAVRAGIGRLPSRTSWGHVVGLAAIAGIGFTVSLFVTSLAFVEHAEYADLAKIGIFAGSLVSGVLGYSILSRTRPLPLTEVDPESPEPLAVG